MNPRSSRVGDQIRVEIADLLTREIHDPGIGFITVTYVRVTSDLQLARVYYTSLGDEKGRRETERALRRATPYLRRQIGRRLRLRRTPELQFFFDETVERHERIERILQDLQSERMEAASTHDGPGQDEPPRNDSD